MTGNETDERGAAVHRHRPTGAGRPGAEVRLATVFWPQPYVRCTGRSVHWTSGTTPRPAPTIRGADPRADQVPRLQW